jgi:hypothetical protein
MNPEQERQCGVLDDAVEAARETCDRAAIDLICTELTTHAGIIAAIRYIQIQMRDDINMPPTMSGWLIDEEGDGGGKPAWLHVFLETIASATAGLARKASEANT